VGATNDAPYIGCNSGVVLFQPGETGNFDAIFASSINDGAVHHFRVRMSGGTEIRLFIDGVLTNTVTGSYEGYSGASPVIGRYNTDNIPWRGGIGEIAVFNQALGDGSDFTAPTSEYSGMVAGLIASYSSARQRTMRIGESNQMSPRAGMRTRFTPFNTGSASIHSPPPR